MATLYKASGKTENVEPHNGETFELDEMQRMAGGWIEFVYLRDHRIAVVNEEGILRQLPYNETASQVCYRHLLGDVLVATRKEVGE